jgi:hypothetical protein
MFPVELGPDKYLAGETQQQLQTIDPSSRQRGHPLIPNPQLSEDSLKKSAHDHRLRPDTRIDWPTDRQS